MKKISYLAICVIACAIFIGCTKTVQVTAPTHRFVIRTDFPPNDTALFPPGSTYAQFRDCYISRTTIDSSLSYGNRCLNVFDPNTNQWQSFDCGIWHLVPAVAYWGEVIKNGDTTLYLGASVIWYAVSPNDYLTAIDLIRYNGQGLAYVIQGSYYYVNGTGYWNNPIGATSRLVNFRPR